MPTRRVISSLEVSSQMDLVMHFILNPRITTSNQNQLKIFRASNKESINGSGDIRKVLLIVGPAAAESKLLRQTEGERFVLLIGNYNSAKEFAVGKKLFCV